MPAGLPRTRRFGRVRALARAGLFACALAAAGGSAQAQQPPFAPGSGTSPAPAVRPCANCGTVVSVRAARPRSGWQATPDSHVALPGRAAGSPATAASADGGASLPGAGTRLEGASMAGRPMRYGAAPPALPHPDLAEFDAAAARRGTWETLVRMEDGTVRRFESGVQPTWPLGARVKVVNGIVVPR